jgi:uroporphyrinogen-III synthase
MRIILTRPRHDCDALAQKLSGLGHNVIRAPLIEIAARPPATIPGTSFQAVVLSSANAARAMAGHADLPRIAPIPAFAVGEQSATAARLAGFQHAAAAGGSAMALADALIARLRPADGPILYLSGADVAGDVAGRLRGAEFAVNRVILYDAIAADRLPPEAELVVRDGTGGGVLLYSPRTATIWRNLLEAAGLAPGPLVHYCLSANVAAALAVSYKAVVAERPSEASLLALLGGGRDGGT